jgi:hypothetical protein
VTSLSVEIASFICIIFPIQLKSLQSPGTMADTDKIHDASSDDPEKVTELTQKATFGEGELDDVVFKHANLADADEALKAFSGHEGETIVITPEDEKRLLRKIDLNLMPASNPVTNSSVSADGASPDALRCIWSQLSRQNYSLIRQYNGPPERYTPAWHELPMARVNVLYWVSSLGISYESFPPATSFGEMVLIQHHYVGSDTLLHGRDKQLRRCSRSTFLLGSV